MYSRRNFIKLSLLSFLWTSYNEAKGFEFKHNSKLKN